MIEKLKLDMTGLKLLVIAYIVSLCGGLVLGLLGGLIGGAVGAAGASGDADAIAATTSSLSMLTNLASAGMGIAVIVLMIIGYNKLITYSQFFKKARLYYIISLFVGIAVAIVFGIIAVVFVIGNIQAIEYGDYSSIGGVVVIVCVGVAIAMIISTILSILNIRYTCYGIQEMAVAASCGMTAESFRKMEKTYRICSIIAMVGSAISLIAIGVVGAQAVKRAMYIGNADDYSAFFSLLGGAVIMFMLFIAFAIMMVVVEIILTVRLYKAWKTLEGKEVAAQRAERGYRLMAPAKAEPSVNAAAATAEAPVAAEAATEAAPTEEVAEAADATAEEKKEEKQEPIITPITPKLPKPEETEASDEAPRWDGPTEN